MKKAVNIFLLVAAVSVSAFLYMRYRIAPDIETFNIEYVVDGQSTNLASLKGQNVVVSFYASWCGTCIGEFPHLIEAHTDLQDEDFVFIALTDDSPEKIEKMKNHFQAPFGLYPLKTTLKKNGIYSLPTTYVINKKGEVVFKKVEELDWSDAGFIKEIRQLVQ